MCNGDELKDIPVREMLSFHQRYAAIATIALTTVDNVSEYGVVKMDKNRILSFVEKPSEHEAPSNLINAGFYILEPEIFDIIHTGKVSIEREIFPILARRGNLFGFQFKGQWFPTDTPARLEIARREWHNI
jgi:NDP-sugar pyrophosphorylase family protein